MIGAENYNSSHKILPENCQKFIKFVSNTIGQYLHSLYVCQLLTEMQSFHGLTYNLLIINPTFVINLIHKSWV